MLLTGAYTYPNWTAAADLNGDGKPDLITADTHNDTGGPGADDSVLINTSTPTSVSFAGYQFFPTGIVPNSVTTADLNGDGNPDITTANSGSNTVSVLLNTTVPQAPMASFAPQQTFVVGLGPSSVTTADINGDGKPDLIAANAASDSVSVLLNTTVPFLAASTSGHEQLRHRQRPMDGEKSLP